MSSIGTQTKEISKYKLAELYIEEHITEVAVCKNCEAEIDKANINIGRWFKNFIT